MGTFFRILTRVNVAQSDFRLRCLLTVVGLDSTGRVGFLGLSQVASQLLIGRSLRFLASLATFEGLLLLICRHQR